MNYGLQRLGKFLCDLYLSVSDTEFHCGFSLSMNFFFCNSWKTFHASPFFAARCVFKSSSAYVFLGKIAHKLLICWVVSYYESRLCILSSHYALWQCDQVRRKRLFVFVVVPDVSVGSTQLTWGLPTWEGQDALLMFLLPGSRGARTFTVQQAHSYIPDRVHWLFTSGSFSCCFSSLIRYYLWALRQGERAISPSSAPSVPVTSPGWQQRSSFGIHLQRGKTHQNVKRSAQKTHLSGEESGQGCQWGKDSLGGSWECWT